VLVDSSELEVSELFVVSSELEVSEALVVSSELEVSELLVDSSELEVSEELDVSFSLDELDKEVGSKDEELVVESVSSLQDTKTNNTTRIIRIDKIFFVIFFMMTS
jgi:hypothetical protein